jgi:hypothetical protein
MLDFALLHSAQHCDVVPLLLREPGDLNVLFLAIFGPVGDLLCFSFVEGEELLDQFDAVEGVVLVFNLFVVFEIFKGLFQLVNVYEVPKLLELLLAFVAHQGLVELLHLGPLQHCSVGRKLVNL